MNKKLNLSVVGLAIGLCISGLLTATKAGMPNPSTLTGFSLFGPTIFNLAGETNYVTIQQWPGQTASPFTIVDNSFTELFAVRVNGSIDINNGANQINADGSGTISSGSIIWGANDGSMSIAGGNVAINSFGGLSATSVNINNLVIIDSTGNLSVIGNITGVANISAGSGGFSFNQDGSGQLASGTMVWTTSGHLSAAFEGDGSAITNLSSANLPYRAGTTNIGNLATTLRVTFTSALPNTSYSVGLTFDTTLGAAVSAAATLKTTTGFTIALSGGIAGGASIDYTAWPWH